MTSTTATWLDSIDAETVEAALDQFSGQPTYSDLMDYADSDERFALWLFMANRWVFQDTGLEGIDDLEDWMWRDAFDAGHSPRGAVTDALADMGLGI